MLSILVRSCDRTRACGFAYACMHAYYCRYKKAVRWGVSRVFVVGDIRALEIPCQICVAFSRRLELTTCNTTEKTETLDRRYTLDPLFCDINYSYQQIYEDAALDTSHGTGVRCSLHIHLSMSRSIHHTIPPSYEIRPSHTYKCSE